MVLSFIGLILLSPFLQSSRSPSGPKMAAGFSQTRAWPPWALVQDAFPLDVSDADSRPQRALSNQLKEGVTFKLKDDPRMTRVGKWLRKYSFDELPQLYNVLIGDMSLVGPRPPVPREVALYRPSDRRRLAAKPGITCIWQISGRSEIDFSGQVGLDVGYIESQSFLTDLKILIKTIPAVLSGKGACL